MRSSAAAALAAATLAAQVGLVLSLGLNPPIEWSLGHLGSGLAGQRHRLRRALRSLPAAARAVSRCARTPASWLQPRIAGLAVLIAQSLTLAGTGPAGLASDR